jgi:hypothetical protein
MSSTFLPTTQQIRESFTREIAGAGGTVSDAHDDGRRLFLRSILPLTREVRPGDMVQGGVALRAVAGEILVHPYVFRQVCRNGAIIAQSLESRRLERVEDPSGAEGADVLAEVGETVRACCAEEAFADVASRMESATRTMADQALEAMALLSRMPHLVAADLIPDVLERFGTAGDRSAFGVVNAVTSLARDTPDQQRRWDLEELGGLLLRTLDDPAPRPLRGGFASLRTDGARPAVLSARSRPGRR